MERLLATLGSWAGFFFLLGALACRPSAPQADLVIINGQEPESIDPAVATGQADMRVAQALFEGLVRFDPVTATPTPGLAERWSLSPDGRTYTFHLRPTARWSTGEPITAGDVAASWQRVLQPETGADYVGQFFYIVGAEAFHLGPRRDPRLLGFRALDDRTFQVELLRPTPFFLNLCALSAFAVVPMPSIQKLGDQWLKANPLPVSGAYALDFWRLNDRIRLRKNPAYWDASNTISETIDLIPCANASTALNLYETGFADIVWDKDLIPADLFDAVLQRPDFQRYQYLGTYFLRLNVTRPPFSDVRVRRALAHAVDRRRIVEQVTRAGEPIATHLVPPGIPNYQSPEGLSYDPDTARKLLAEAGFPEGRGFPSVSYLYNSQRAQEKIAVELQEMWRRELGITVELRPVEWKVFLSEQSQLRFDLSRSSWIGDYNDPNTFLDLFTSGNGNNRTGWKNPAYDALLNRGNGELDPARRAALLAEAEQLLLREAAPIIPIYFYVGFEYFRPDQIFGVHTNILAEHPLRVIGKRRPPAPTRP